jgi:hypothetical protein
VAGDAGERVLPQGVRHQGEALEEAKRLAKQAELGQVKVHKKDGNMEYENTYGEDPRRSPS